jgi:hypothetical protein
VATLAILENDVAQRNSAGGWNRDASWQFCRSLELHSAGRRLSKTSCGQNVLALRSQGLLALWKERQLTSRGFSPL